MATAVHQPQDCLMKNPYFRQPLRFPQPSKHVGGGGRTPNRSSRSGGRRKRSPSDNESDRSGCVVKFPTKDIVMGQVKILKRGEKIENLPTEILNRSNEINERKIVKNIVNTPPKRKNKRRVEEKNSDDDLFMKERLGPDPEIIPKEIKFTINGLFSGSVAVVSPSPNSLPFPTFSLTKKKSAGLNNYSATKDLIRMFGMM